MKILSSTQYFYPPPGGGEHALRNLLRYLQDAGHDVAAAYVGEEDDPDIRSHPLSLPRLPGGWTRKALYAVPWKRHIRNVIAAERPDHVVTQLGLAPPTVAACQEFDVEVSVLLISYDHLCISQFMGPGEAVEHACLRHAPWKFRVQWPFFRRVKTRFRRALAAADHVFANSRFMQTVTRDQLGIDSAVVYPFIDLDRVAVPEGERDPEYITMINPSRYKGGAIVVELAERMPDERFLALGTGEADIMRRIEQADNIDQVDHVEHIRDVYARTKLLLAPSQWPEPFGMVVPEAMHNGIPVLVSATGGLPEAARSDRFTVEQYGSADAWESRLRDASGLAPPGDAASRFSTASQAERMLHRIGEA